MSIAKSIVKNLVLALLLGSALSFAGCASVIPGGQERSAGRAIDDFSIQARLGHNLRRISRRNYRNVDLEVVEARVLMTGRVSTPEIRLEATRIAWATNGVDDVLNEIEVSDRGVSMVRPGDTWITSRLRGRLIGDAGVEQANYHIEVLHGTVYLFGIAQTQEELERAADHARDLRGVEQVISHVRVKMQRPPLREQGA